MFDKMTIKNVNMFIVKYPELKTIEALNLLIKNINTLKGSIYDQDFCIIQVKQRMYFRTIDPWVLNSWIPIE
jgi:hypothetical protein